MVCPTGAIKIEDIEDKRKIDIWHTELKRAKCKMCGEYFFPQATVDYVRKRGAEKVKDLLELCPNCRKVTLVNKLNKIKYLSNF